MVIPCKDEQQRRAPRRKCPWGAPRQPCTLARSGRNRKVRRSEARKPKSSAAFSQAHSGQLRFLGSSADADAGSFLGAQDEIGTARTHLQRPMQAEAMNQRQAPSRLDAKGRQTFAQLKGQIDIQHGGGFGRAELIECHKMQSIIIRIKIIITHPPTANGVSCERTNCRYRRFPAALQWFGTCQKEQISRPSVL